MHPKRRPLLRPLALIVLQMFGVPTWAAPLTLSNIPLFLSTNTPANLMMLFGNSNSMDEDPNGSAIGSASSASKSEIARGVVNSLVSQYQNQINMGLMSYQQTTSGADPVRLYALHNSPYDLSYNPANYDPSFTGARESLTKHARIPNVSNPGAYLYYNVALPFYSATSQGNAFCYSSTANAFNNGENPVTGPWDSYSCYGSKTGLSDTVPTDSASAAAAGYGSFKYNTSFLPTDSDLGQGITDFGHFLAWNYVSPSWFSNGSPGYGYVHVPIGPLDSTQSAKINVKMGTSQFTTNAPNDPAYPLQNAGLTPLDGSVITAQRYFSGTLSDSTQGGPLAAPPQSCGKNFLVMLTNGLPSVDRNGNPSSDTTTMLSTLASSVGNLFSTTQTSTYVIGFALPYGVNPAQLNTIAQAGNTTLAYNAADQASLSATLGNVFSDIVSKTGAAAAVSMNSGSASTSSVAYQARFDSTTWSGQLLAIQLATDGSPTSTLWDAGDVINSQAPASRTILTYKPSTAKGIPFRWPATPSTPTATELDVAQSTRLNTSVGGSVDNLGSGRVNWLRGSSSNEGAAPGQFRPRPTSKLGDIVDSSPVYVGTPAMNYSDPTYQVFRTSMATRTPVVYVGANDGMLHGFNANTGAEVLAYIPSKSYAGLPALTTNGYAHRFFVDGPMASGDVYYGSAWHTLLIAPMAAGGRGISVLDVTNPATFSEANAANLVRFEFNDAQDADVGFIYSRPSLVKLNTGRWAIVFGNGYNPANTGQSSLFIVDAETGALIRKLSTGVGTVTNPNGLAGAAAVDDDGNRTIDSVYAGDQLGNLWKFDLSSADSTQWKVAFSGAPLFNTSGTIGVRPITTTPEVSYHPQGGSLILFGTGQYLQAADVSSTATNAFFGVRDNGVALGASPPLVQQTVTGTIGGSDGNLYRMTSANTIDWTTKKGWYLLLPESGERSVSDPILRNGRVIFNSMTPPSSPCATGGSSWLMEVDYLSGGQLKIPPFDINADNLINSGDLFSGKPPSGRHIATIGSTPSVLTGVGDGLERKLITESGATITGVLESGSSRTTRRTSWQQIR